MNISVFRHLPKLMFLLLGGNDLITFPHRSLKENVAYLGINRCRLLLLPDYLHEFDKLRYLDARYNNISNVDSNLLSLIDKNEVESYFAGNDIACRKHKELDCKPLCSMYCSSRNAPKNNYCDAECNSERCSYDGGDCMREVV